MNGNGKKREKGTELALRIVVVGIHCFAWLYLFLALFLFREPDSDFSLLGYMRATVLPLSMLIVFYVNYFVFVPRIFLRRKYRNFILFNLLLYGCMMLLHQSVDFGREKRLGAVFGGTPPAVVGHMNQQRDKVPPANHLAGTPPPQEAMPTARFQLGMESKSLVRDLTIYIFLTAVSVFILLAMRWQKAEHARLQAEHGRVEAELKNLRSQIDPHFLLNTLNNIYSLTAIDTIKAQDALHRLSQLLRTVLYENQTERVNLVKEWNFLENYVALMKIRLNDNVEIKTESVIADKELTIAPLIFISLVENAFKHGVSTFKPSFIHIQLSASEEAIRFVVSNSNFPKPGRDKSGHRIGLNQVQRRLELAYPNAYTWYYGATKDNTVYLSSILINLKRLCH